MRKLGKNRSKSLSVGVKTMKKILFLTGIVVLVFLAVPVMAQQIIPNDTTKTIIMHFHIKGENITFLDAHVTYGHPPSLMDIPDDFTGKMLGPNDVPVTKFGLDDPRIFYLDRGAAFNDDINMSVKIPYTDKVDIFGIYNTKTDQNLVRVDTKKIMADFCKSHPNDPDCSLIKPWMFAIIIIIAIIGCGIAFYYVKKRGKPGKN
jgi:hypothetical protein